MTAPGRRRAAAVAMVAAATVAAGCTSAPAGSVPASAPFPTAPLATTIAAADGTWAALPMGHLSQPLNTFWQLVTTATATGAATSWHNDVEATATATNGGLAVATAGATVMVGVRPSDELTYSPVVVTTDGGASWTSGVLPQGLAPATDALALDGADRAAAVVRTRSADEVVESAGSWTDWRATLTGPSLGSGAGRACRPRALTAVGFVGSTAVVGARCGATDAGALFVLDAGRAVAVGPPVAGATEAVLGLRPAGGGLDALLELAHGPTATVEVAATTDGRHWTTSAPLPLGSARLGSYSSAADGTTAVELIGSGGRPTAWVHRPSAAAWQQLPDPPAATAVVALTGDDAPEALSVASTVLTVWQDPTGADTWSKHQVIDVPIQFGSSD